MTAVMAASGAGGHGPGDGCRVLSLDGGGIKGVFTAAYLAALEENTGCSIARCFDLIVGTSTGGIIALALAAGLSASEVLAFYRLHGPNIFPRRRLLERASGAVLREPLTSLLFSGLRPRFEQTPLRRALDGVFGTRDVGSLKTRVVIPAYNAAANSVRLFKTPHHGRFFEDHRRSLVEVALATSAAPTYFAGLVTAANERFIDGGVWANCPAVVGILEALMVLERPLDSIGVLSVGTTEAPFHVPPTATRGGLWSWLSKKSLPTLMLDAPAVAAVAQARLLCGERFMRINRVVEPGRFDLADAKQIPELEALGGEEARHTTAQVRSRFLYAETAPFAPRVSNRSGPASDS